MFSNRSQLKAVINSDPKLSLAKSLTKRTFQLLAKSQKAFGFQNVWTLKGKFIVTLKARGTILMISEISQRLDFHAESHNLFAFYYLICTLLTTPHDIPKTLFSKFQVIHLFVFIFFSSFFVFIFFSFNEIKFLYFLCFCNIAKCII